MSQYIVICADQCRRLATTQRHTGRLSFALENHFLNSNERNCSLRKIKLVKIHFRVSSLTHCSPGTQLFRLWRSVIRQFSPANQCLW